MSTKVEIKVEDDQTNWLVGGGSHTIFAYTTTKPTKQGAVIDALVAFVRQFEDELEEAKRELFEAVDLIRASMTYREAEAARSNKAQKGGKREAAGG